MSEGAAGARQLLEEAVAFSLRGPLWLRLLLLLPVVPEVTGPLLLFIYAVGRNLSEHGF